MKKLASNQMELVQGGGVIQQKLDGGSYESCVFEQGVATAVSGAIGGALAGGPAGAAIGVLGGLWGGFAYGLLTC